MHNQKYEQNIKIVQECLTARCIQFSDSHELHLIVPRFFRIKLSLLCTQHKDDQFHSRHTNTKYLIQQQCVFRFLEFFFFILPMNRFKQRFNSNGLLLIKSHVKLLTNSPDTLNFLVQTRKASLHPNL